MEIYKQLISSILKDEPNKRNKYNNKNDNNIIKWNKYLFISHRLT